VECVKAAGALVVERAATFLMAGRWCMTALILVNYQMPLRIIELDDELPGYPQF
jgi:hypothetical protein